MSYAIDPQLADSLSMLPTPDPSDLAATRARAREVFARMPAPDLTGVRTEDRTVPGPDGEPDIRVRIYRPDRSATTAGLFCVHGGAFMVGDLETEHRRCVSIARESGAVVVSVGYRLAPETPYPGPLEDVYAGLVWFADHAHELGVDPERIAIRGISAGGGLCAGLALLARDRRGPSIMFQYLGAPELDDRLTTPSMTAYVDTPMMDRANVVASWEAYLGSGVPGSVDVPPYAAPARATDLRGLPSAYVSVMHFDPLRDEGMEYALRMLAAGVTVELHLFPGTFHGSSLVSHAEVSRRDAAEETAVLRRVLQPL